MKSYPLLARCDVAVVGGGPSGIAAALSAARNGAKVVLLEQTGTLGGMSTSGLVPTFAPASDGTRLLYGGIYEEMAGELCRRMNVPLLPGSWQAINPEVLKRIYDEIVEKAEIQVFFDVKACEVEMNQARITAVWFAAQDGLQRVEARQFIDATGDALMAVLAGVPFDLGDENHSVMSPTLCAQFAGIDFSRYQKSCDAGRSDRVIWAELSNAGKAPLHEKHFICMKQTGESIATSNLGHIYGCSPLDPHDRSNAYREGRRIVHEFEKFFREHVPGFEHAVLVSSAGLLGVRESRRIHGEYRMTLADYQHKAVFEDEIGRCCYPIDIHASSDNPETQEQVEKILAATQMGSGESYGIPYRALIPLGIENLLVPGRALSADRSIQSSLRIMPAAFVTGQAAGTAAAMAGGSDVRTIDTTQLQARLRAMGAVISNKS